MNALIETLQLKKRFRAVEALDGVDLTIPEGSIYALVGPNGAGKTTFFRTLLNIYRPDGGTAKILGTDSRRLQPEQLARLGYVSEATELPGWMSVSGYLSYLQPFYPTWDTAYCDELLRQFALPLDRRLKDLSRGMRMKVALVSSLAYHPELLLLDEPFSGLDAAVRDDLIRALLDQAEPLTVVVASHDLGEIESFASHVAYLESGKLRANEEMSALTARFRDVFLTFPGTAPAERWPEGWLQPETTGGTVHFVDPGWSESSEHDLRERYPAARVESHPMSLRQIFVALARS